MVVRIEVGSWLWSGSLSCTYLEKRKVVGHSRYVCGVANWCRWIRVPNHSYPGRGLSLTHKWCRCIHTHTHTHTWLVRTGLIACRCVQIHVISSRYLVEGECPTVHIPVVKTVGKVTWLARNENWVLLWILDSVLKGCAHVPNGAQSWHQLTAYCWRKRLQVCS